MSILSDTKLVLEWLSENKPADDPIIKETREFYDEQVKIWIEENPLHNHFEELNELMRDISTLAFKRYAGHNAGFNMETGAKVDPVEKMQSVMDEYKQLSDDELKSQIEQFKTQNGFEGVNNSNDLYLSISKYVLLERKYNL